MTNPICSAMRSAPADSHDDLHDVLACLAAMIKRPSSSLSDKAKATIVDMLDEITGQVENDQIEQRVEADWHNYEMNANRHVPGFAGVYAQLDALTVRRAAA